MRVEREFIGDTILRLRKERGLSAADCTRLSGGQISERTVWRAERAGVVTERTARILAPLLGVQPDDLLPPGGR